MRASLIELIELCTLQPGNVDTVPHTLTHTAHPGVRRVSVSLSSEEAVLCAHMAV